MKFLTKQEEIIVKLCHPELMELATRMDDLLKTNPHPHGLVRVDFSVMEDGKKTKTHMVWDTPIGNVGYLRCRKDVIDDYFFIHIWTNPTTEYGWEFGLLAMADIDEWFATDFPFVTSRIPPIKWLRRR